MKNHTFLKTVVVRNPLLKKERYLEWDKIIEIFNKPENREALFLGSPTLYEAFIRWEKGEAFTQESELINLKGSLYKYASRLSNRSTPFGLFATVGTAEIASESSFSMSSNQIQRRTKFDMFFLSNLQLEITRNSTIRNTLVFFTNSSMYEVLDKYRYVEYYYKDNVRFHKISEVHKTEYLDKIIHFAKLGATKADLIQVIIDAEITIEEATSFIDKVIDSQFLISEVEFTLTGPDYFEQIIEKFSDPRFDFHEAQVILNFFKKLYEKLKKLDHNLSNEIDYYYAFKEELETQLGKEIDLSKLFQVDTFRKIENGTISSKIQKSLRNGVILLNKLQSASGKTYLDDFKEKFLKRYEEYEIPLIKVLDPDIGIGYGNNSGAKTPLLDLIPGVIQGSSSSDIKFDYKNRFLFKKILKANIEKLQEISITDEELNKFVENESAYPTTFSVFTQIFQENEEEKIYLKTVSGSTANVLIGRFSYLDNKITALSDEINQIEEKYHSDKIIAEIVHLPQARTGNVLYRSRQRKFEIPYLGHSSLALDHQININDLMISVKHNRIILRSVKHNKEVIPRLSNAHNYSYNSLPIYHFLCDLQHQDSKSFGFSWGSLSSEFDFLPRLSYKNLIFCRATWTLKKPEIEELHKKEPQDIFTFINDFRKTKNMPDEVSFVQGDNEVVINFNSQLSCHIFYLMLKGESYVELKEFLFKEDCITEEYCNEFVFSAVPVEKESKVNTTTLQVHANDIKDSYVIGDEWVYFKFYCGERVAEEILNQSVAPIVAQLKENNLIHKWFFIRYNDSDGFHLRVRFQVKQLQNIQKVIELVHLHIQPFLENGYIWKVQADKYLREIQRYGANTVELAEEIFHLDSQNTLEFVQMIEGDEGERIRWLFALLSIDHLLDDFDLDLKQKMKLLEKAKTNFDREFNRSGLLNKKINETYKNFELKIDQFLDHSIIDKDYEPLWEILKIRSQANIPVIKKIIYEINRDDSNLEQQNLLLSYIHMICNRILISKFRLQEMLIYDFLYKFYNKKLNQKLK